MGIIAHVGIQYLVDIKYPLSRKKTSNTPIKSGPLVNTKKLAGRMVTGLAAHHCLPINRFKLKDMRYRLSSFPLRKST
jgi:hypothetical protein